MNMNKKALVTIIVPIYKVEKYLRECIDSIVSQTYKNLEIILIDDESPDSCPMICDEYTQKDKRIIVKHKKNGGLSDARNLGIDIATGDFIMFVDSDDLIDRHIVQFLLNSINTSHSDIACCQFRYIDELTVIGKAPNNLKKSYTISHNDCIYELLTKKDIGVYAWAKLYKKELFQEVRYPVGRLHEDVFTTYKLVDKANSISIIPDALYCYRIRNDSITTQKITPKHIDAVYAKIALNNFVEDKYPKLSKYSKALLAYSCALCIYKIISSHDSLMLSYIPYLRQILKKNIKYFVFYGNNRFSSKIVGIALSFFPSLINELVSIKKKRKQ